MAGIKNIADTVRQLAEPVANGLDLMLWDVEFVKEGARRILRITIDSEEGVTIEDCEKMHRAIDPVLDEADPIESAYELEVTSPGIERDIRTDAHIKACVDWDVEMRLFAPVDGVKSFRGILKGLSDSGEVLLETADGEQAFPRAAVAKIKSVFEF